MGAQTNESIIPTPATPDVCTAKILVEGQEIPGTLQVLSMVVSRELNRIPMALLHISDGEAARSTFEVSNTDLFIPGKKIEIQMGYRAQDDPVFKGIVVRNSVKIRSGGSFLIVECRDETVKMTGGRKSGYFTEKKDSDIMEELIGRHGLQKEVEATKPDLKEVVQYESTDWDFLLCRAEANGLVVAVADGKVTVAKPDAAQEPVLTVLYGATLLELDADIDAQIQSPGIKATSWSAADQAPLEAEAKEPGDSTPGNLSASDLSAVLGSDPHELRHGGPVGQSELQAWADARLLKERLAKVRGRARFQGFAGALPGKVIEVKGIGERFEGKALIAGVRHSFADGNWTTDVQFGLSPDLFAETFNLRPMPAAGLLPAVSGLQLGIVTKLEGDPDGEDRIKVRLPLVSTEDEGLWARLATLDAGQNRGTYFRPEIDDEVVVGFFNDDPRYPVVLGQCHSSAKPAPLPATDDNHEKGYVSRAEMKLTFNDDKKIIALETPAGNKFSLSEEDKAILIEDQNGNKITMDADGIKIESAKDLILKATNDVSIEGVNMELKAQSAFKAQGTGSAELSSGASTTVKGSANTVIQGGVVQIN